MAAIDASSTLQQVQAAYDDNASYASVPSVPMARDFVTAARILLRRIPGESSTRDGGVKFQLELISKEIDKAETWIAENRSLDTTSTLNAPQPFTRTSTQFMRR